MTDEEIEASAAVLAKSEGYTTLGAWFLLYAKPTARAMLEAAEKVRSQEAKAS